MANKLSQRQLVATITPTKEVSSVAPRFDGKFAQVTGGEITAPVEKVYDGGELFPDVLCAPPEVGDVTVTRHFEPVRDGVPLKQLRRMVGNAFYDVNVFILNCDLKEAGSDRTYAKALLVGLSEPEGDSASGAPATFSLTFSISAVSSLP